MPLSGGGVKTRVNDFTNNAASDINPTAVQFDNEFDDADACFNLVWWKDGRNAPTADMSMGGFVLENVGTAVLGTDALNRDTADARYATASSRSGMHLSNASLTSSVAANALTITLQTAAGATPSASDPVVLAYRSTTATTSTIATLSITATLTLTVSSGSSLGVGANNRPFRLWVVVFNDGGTARLGVIQPFTSVQISGFEVIQQITRLRGGELASSTGEGGAGAADAPSTFYTGTAVTSKPYAVLGYLEWDSGLATAGTWATDATLRQTYHPGVPLPGDIVQYIYEPDAVVATGTTTIPFDNTAPQNTEGDQYAAAAIVPTSKINILDVHHKGSYASSSTVNGLTVAIFQDSTADALAANAFGRDAGAGAVATGEVRTWLRAGTVSSTTLKVRAGSSAAGTTTYNGTAGAGLYNGRLISYLNVSEIMV